VFISSWFAPGTCVRVCMYVCVCVYVCVRESECLFPLSRVAPGIGVCVCVYVCVRASLSVNLLVSLCLSVSILIVGVYLF